MKRYAANHISWIFTYFLAILTVLLILLGISLFGFIVYKIINRNKSKDDEEIKQIIKKPRVQSLDTFRG